MSKPIMIVCEGNSDVVFFSKLIENRDLADKIEVFNPGKPDKKIVEDDDDATESECSTGINAFERHLRTVRTRTGGHGLRLIVLVADHDEDVEKNFKCVQDQIGRAGGYGVPERPREICQPKVVGSSDIVVLMLPWDDEVGNIETILFRAGEEKSGRTAECVAQFAAAIDLTGWKISSQWKFKARSMMSATAKRNPDVPIARAWSSKYGLPFPIESQYFNRYADFLGDMVSQYG